MEDKKDLNNKAKTELPADELENITGGSVGVYTKAKKTVETLLPLSVDESILNPSFLIDNPLSIGLNSFEDQDSSDSDSV